MIVWYTLYFAAIQQPLLWLTSAIIYLVQFSCIYDSWMTVLGSILCLLISFLFLILDCNIRYYFCTPLFTCFDFYKLAKKKKKRTKKNNSMLIFLCFPYGLYGSCKRDRIWVLGFHIGYACCCNVWLSLVHDSNSSTGRPCVGFWVTFYMHDIWILTIFFFFNYPKFCFVF